MPGMATAPLDRALTRVGDRWTLLLVEALLEGPMRYGELADAVTGVIADGARQKVFRPIHPALAHFTLIGPLVMYRASAPMRARIKAIRHVDIQEADSDAIVQHLQMVARRMLALDGAGGASGVDG